MKDKKVLIGIVVLVLLVLSGIGYFVFAGRMNSPEEEQAAMTEELPSLSPEEIGLEIVPSSDKKYVQFKVTKLDGITYLEWEFTYDADNPEPAEGAEQITQGFGGEADIDGSKDEFVSEKRELGTCSTGGKCRFDTGIEKVDLLLKVTKDGKVYQSEASKEL